LSSRLSRDEELLDEPLDEGQRRVGHFTPSAVDDEGVTAVRHLDDLGDGLVALLLLVGGVRDRPANGVVLLAGDDERGARSGFLVSTFASVQGLRFAVAAWKSGTPDAGTANVS